MANELQSLSQLFQNRLFRIPDYQRGYAWQQPQLVDFWDDLINLNEDRYHYTGLLSLKALSRKETKTWGSDLWMVDKGYRPCHIVDGQQRLTTFVILVNEIVCFVRGLEENKNLSDKQIVIGYETLEDIVNKYIFQSRPPQNIITTYLFGYEVDNPSAEYLRYRIFNEPYAGSVKETYYTKNLKFAKQFFSDNLKALYDESGLQGINELYQKMTLRLMFNIHEIDDDYDVFVAFETMNNRGKKLTNLELLKNRLIYLTTIYEDVYLDEYNKNELRKKINDAWKEVYYQLGRNKVAPLSDDEFLRAHWILYFSYTRKRGDDYIRFLLRKFSAKNVFTKKTIVQEDTPITEVDDELVVLDDDEIIKQEDSETELVIVTQLEPKEIQDYVLSLKNTAKHWYDTFFPYESDFLTDEEKLWIDRLNRIGIGYFRPLVMAALSVDAKPTERIALFEAIERFLFFCFRLGNYQATYWSSECNRAARSLYMGDISIIIVTKDIKDVVQRNIEYTIPNFITRIEKRFSSGDGFYGWSSLRYFLYEYEYALAEKLNASKKISWEMFSKTEKDKVSIEHILPQTPTKRYWQNMFRQYSAEEKKILSGALGNLLPLSQSVNSSLQNDSFDEKKHMTNGRRGYENGSHSEIEVSKLPDWDANQIYLRSLHLLDFMEKRWQFSLTEEQKKQLVYIHFVKDGRAVPNEIIEEVKQDKDGNVEEKDPHLRFHYWEFALKRIKDRLVKDGHGPYSNVNPSDSSFKDGFFGIGGIHLYCSISQRPKKCVAGLWIDSGNAEKNRLIYNVLLTHKDEIDSKISFPLTWSAKDDRRSCGITTSIEGNYLNQEEWTVLAAFHAKACFELAHIAFYPYKEEIRSVKE